MKPFRHQPPIYVPRENDERPGRVKLVTWVTEQTEAAIQVAANRRGMSRSFYIASVLMKHVEEKEWWNVEKDQASARMDPDS